MTEPDLAGYAPIAEMVDPVEIRFLKAFRDDIYVAGADGVLHKGFQRYCFSVSLERFGDIHEPLFFDLRFDDAAAAAVYGDIVDVILIGFCDKPFRCEFFSDFCSCLGNIHTGEFAGDCEKFSVVADDLFFAEVVPLGDVEVGRVVPGGDGHGACAETHIDCFVFDEGGGYLPIDPFDVLYFLPVSVRGISLVVRMHDNVFVPEFGFGACGTDDEWTVLQIIEWRFFFAALDFIVGNGGLEFWIPIDDARSAVNDAVFKHAAERFIDCFVSSFVERVRFARPIKRGAHFFALVDDGVV